MGDKKEPSKTTDDAKLSNDVTKKTPLRRVQTFATWQRVKSIGSEVELSPEAENEFKLKLQKARQRASEGAALSPVTPSPVTHSPVTPSPISEKKEVPKKVEAKPLVTASEVKPETPKETPSIEVPKEPKKEEPQVKEEPKKEEPTKEEPIKEEPKKEEPTKEEPIKEEPKKEEPKKEEPKKQEPKKEEPKKQEFKKFEPPKQEFKKFEPPKQEFKKFDPVKKDIVSPKSPPTPDESKKKVQYGVQFQGFQAIANPIQTRTFGVAKSNANATKNATSQPWQRTSTIADFRVESIQKRESTLKKRDSFVGGSPFQGVVAGDPLAGLEAKRKLSQSIQSKKPSLPLSPTSSKDESELAKRFAEKQKLTTTTTPTPSTTATTTTTTPAKNTFKRLP